MKWTVEYLKEAEKDLLALDRSQQIEVLKAIEKVSTNPLPNYEGGYGKALGNYSATKLAGYYKIVLRRSGIRVVYGLVREAKAMKIVVIAMRSDNIVYK